MEHVCIHRRYDSVYIKITWNVVMTFNKTFSGFAQCYFGV
jgi:hypothetical protein